MRSPVLALARRSWRRISSGIMLLLGAQGWGGAEAAAKEGQWQQWAKKQMHLRDFVKAASIKLNKQAEQEGAGNPKKPQQTGEPGKGSLGSKRSSVKKGREGEGQNGKSDGKDKIPQKGKPRQISGRRARSRRGHRRRRPRTRRVKT